MVFERRGCSRVQKDVVSGELAGASVDRSPHTPSRVVETVRAHRYALVVWVGIAAWSTAMFAIVRCAYLGFRLGRFDLGNMVQAVWSTTQGRPLETTDRDGRADRPPGGPRRSVPRPARAALAGLAVAADARCSRRSRRSRSGALPVFWLGRRHLGSERPARPSRARVSRLSVGRDERARTRSIR